jgi:hypothetical protein
VESVARGTKNAGQRRRAAKLEMVVGNLRAPYVIVVGTLRVPYS